MSYQQSNSSKNLNVIIMAGKQGFGRCTLATHLPVALWPLVEKSVLENLLISLSKQGIKQITICFSGDSSLLAKSIRNDCHLELKFLDEQLQKFTDAAVQIMLAESLPLSPEIEKQLKKKREELSRLKKKLSLTAKIESPADSLFSEYDFADEQRSQ